MPPEKEKKESSHRWVSCSESRKGEEDDCCHRAVRQERIQQLVRVDAGLCVDFRGVWIVVVALYLS